MTFRFILQEPQKQPVEVPNPHPTRALLLHGWKSHLAGVSTLLPKNEFRKPSSAVSFACATHHDASCRHVAGRGVADACSRYWAGPAPQKCSLCGQIPANVSPSHEKSNRPSGFKRVPRIGILLHAIKQGHVSSPAIVPTIVVARSADLMCGMVRPVEMKANETTSSC